MAARLLPAAVAALVFAACHPVVFGPLMGSELGEAGQAKCQLARDAWLEPVKIEDADAPNREYLERALTLDLQRFLREEGAYRRVSLLPGEPAPEDLVLRFAFPRFQQTLIRCPGCNYWTLISMGWSPNNMDSWQLTSELSGRLQVKRVTGEEVATSSAELTEDENSSQNPWQQTSAPRSAIATRARLVRRLVLDACHAYPTGSAQ